MAKVPNIPMDVRSIPVASIEIGTQMLRNDPYDDDIQELACDIAAHGLMQPIGVAAIPHDRYQLLWGSRRLAAHVRLARTEIPARICDGGTAEEIIGTAARENLLRRDLTLREEIDALRRLTAEGKSPSQISDLVSKSRAWVDRRLAFDAIPHEIRDHVIEGSVPLGHAEALALVEDTSTRAYLLAHTLAHRPSLLSLRATIAALATTPNFSEAVQAGAAAAQPSPTNPIARLDCHTCDEPIPIPELVVIRCCHNCAAAMRGAAIRPTDTDATTRPQ